MWSTSFDKSIIVWDAKVIAAFPLPSPAFCFLLLTQFLLCYLTSYDRHLSVLHYWRRDIQIQLDVFYIFHPLLVSGAGELMKPFVNGGCLVHDICREPSSVLISQVPSLHCPAGLLVFKSQVEQACWSMNQFTRLSIRSAPKGNISFFGSRTNQNAIFRVDSCHRRYPATLMLQNSTNCGQRLLKLDVVQISLSFIYSTSTHYSQTAVLVDVATSLSVSLSLESMLPVQDHHVLSHI